MIVGGGNFAPTKLFINMTYDISTIGQIDFEWDFDQESYEEWLAEECLDNSKESMRRYVEDGNVEFSLDLMDNDTYHHMAYAYMSLSDIEDAYGEAIANEIYNVCVEDGGGSLEPSVVLDKVIDLNDPKEVGEQARLLFDTEPYRYGDRGFILKDGTFIHTDAEHNMCTRLNGVNGTYHFISLGNIRVGVDCADILAEPTAEQYKVLRTILASFEGEPFYLMIGKHQIAFRRLSPMNVLNQIKRFWAEGIIPQDSMYESTNNTKTSKMGKIIKINEEQFERLFAINEDGEGGAVGGGATSADSSGQFTVPLFGMMRRKFNEPAMKRKDGKGGSISIPKKRAK